MSDISEELPGPTLDRALQRRILQTLAAIYPNGTYELAATLCDPPVVESALLANTQYLAGHELVSSGFVLHETTGGADFIETRLTTLTHKGMDFLQSDGGLSAILGVVQVRLRDEDLRDLVAARISASESLVNSEKTRWIDALRELPGESIKHVFLKVLDLGWDQAPGAIGVIGKLLGL